MADLAEVIRRHPLFSALSREDIAKVLGKMEERYYLSGTTILSQGDEGDAFYIIQTGAVQVVLENRGRAEIIRVLGPQDWFGEMALLSGEPRSATIAARQRLFDMATESPCLGRTDRQTSDLAASFLRRSE